MTRTGIVTQIDYEKGMVKVTLKEEKIESGWLTTDSDTYDMPPVGAQVKCTFDDNNFSTGACRFRHFNKNDMPIDFGEKISYNRMAGDMVIHYDGKTKELIIEAKTIILKGDVQIEGDIEITGSATVDGDIEAGSDVNVSGDLTVGGVIMGTIVGG